MAKNKKNEIWIETRQNLDGTYTFNVGSDWGCLRGFTKAGRKKVFEALKKAMSEAYPTAEINPWSDDEPGSPDFG